MAGDFLEKWWFWTIMITIIVLFIVFVQIASCETVCLDRMNGECGKRCYSILESFMNSIR